MRIRVLAAAVLAAWLPAASAQSPTAAEQLAKAVYTQQTTGDLDAAIQMYRQIIASNPTQRNIVTQVQYRLVQVLLQKGDFNAAGQEFQNLILNYADNRELIMAMAGRINGGASHGMSVTLGKLENGRYHHNQTGIEFNVPSGWKLEGDTQSSDNGEMVLLSQQNSMRSLAVWLKPDPTPSANIAARLQHDVERKHEDRDPGWTVRTSSIQMRSVGGQQALTAIADFSEGKKPMVEYMTWVRSTKSRCFFFGSGAVEDLANIQGAIEQMLASAMVP